MELGIYLEGKIVLTRELSPGSYRVGRLPDNDLVLDSPKVSRHHARLSISPQGGVSIEDLGSANGVLVEERKVQAAQLGPGQSAVIQPYELRFQPKTPPEAQSEATVMMAAPLPYLEVVSGEAPAAKLALKPGVNLVGRLAECDIRLSDPSVSRRHAELEVTPAGVMVRDLGSTSGTLVDGRKVKKARLAPGAQLGLGTVVLRLAGPGTDTAAVPPPLPSPGRKAAKPRQRAAAKGKVRPALLALVVLAVLAAVGLIALWGGSGKEPEPVVDKLAQEQHQQEEEEKRRLVIISLTKAREAFGQGNLQGAEALLKNVLAAEPDNAQAKEMLAQTQAGLTQAEAARQRAQQEAQARAQRLGQLTLQLKSAWQESRYPQVLDLVKQVQAVDPHNALARDLAAKAQDALEQAEHKKRAAKAAGDKRQGEAKRLYDYGVQALQAGDLATAVRALNQVLEVDPRGETPYPAKARGHIAEIRPKLKAKGDEKYAQGQTQLKAGDTAGAMASFGQALQADPWHAEAKAALGNLEAANTSKVHELMQEAEVLESMGDIKGAQGKLNQALALVGPNSPRQAAIKSKLAKFRQ